MSSFSPWPRSLLTQSKPQVHFYYTIEIAGVVLGVVTACPRAVDPGSCKRRLPSPPEIALWLKETVKLCKQEHFYRTQSETRKNERLLRSELGVLRPNRGNHWTRREDETPSIQTPLSDRPDHQKVDNLPRILHRSPKEGSEDKDLHNRPTEAQKNENQAVAKSANQVFEGQSLPKI